MNARVSLLMLLMVLAGSAIQGARADEPARTSTRITPALASALRDLTRYSEVEASLGGAGAEIGRSEESDGPHVVRAWRDDRGGTVRAFVYASGDFSLVMTPAGEADPIVLNSFGAFVCPTCSPPVNACGRRPWWVPHDVHWDNFDCGCTLAGPQSVRVGRC